MSQRDHYLEDWIERQNELAEQEAYAYEAERAARRALADPDWTPETEPDDDVVMTTQEHGEIVADSNALEVRGVVEDDVVAIEVGSGDVRAMIAFPNDGQDHSSALELVLAAFPQAVQAALTQMEAQ